MDSLVVDHIQVNQATRIRRRTYRAHGRINRKCDNWQSNLIKKKLRDAQYVTEYNNAKSIRNFFS